VRGAGGMRCGGMRVGGGELRIRAMPGGACCLRECQRADGRPGAHKLPVAAFGVVRWRTRAELARVGSSAGPRHLPRPPARDLRDSDTAALQPDSEAPAPWGAGGPGPPGRAARPPPATRPGNLRPPLLAQRPTAVGSVGALTQRP
jgi:hypothetical protein